MVATSGDHLIASDTVETLKEYLFPIAALVTPNLDEYAILSGMEIKTIGDMKAAAVRIMEYDCNAVLIKGGHLKGPDLFDVYLDKDENERIYRSTAIETINTHGTGCSLSSAIASYIALGDDLDTSIANSKNHIQSAIEHGKVVKTGDGHGPLNHFFDPQKLVKYEMELSRLAGGNPCIRKDHRDAIHHRIDRLIAGYTKIPILYCAGFPLSGVFRSYPVFNCRKGSPG